MKQSCRPYARPFNFSHAGFIQGVASLLNIAGNHFGPQNIRSQAIADSTALYADWRRIAGDFRRVYVKNPLPAKNG